MSYPQKPHKFCAGCKFLNFATHINNPDKPVPYCNNVKHNWSYELDCQSLDAYNHCSEKQIG